MTINELKLKLKEQITLLDLKVNEISNINFYAMNEKDIKNVQLIIAKLNHYTKQISDYISKIDNKFSTLKACLCWNHVKKMGILEVKKEHAAKITEILRSYNYEVKQSDTMIVVMDLLDEIKVKTLIKTLNSQVTNYTFNYEKY